MTNHPELLLNLVQIFFERARRFGDGKALLYKDAQREFRPVTWSQWAGFVTKTGLGLHSLGIKRGESVAILSENRPEWTYADFGTLGLGAVTVPIYPTSSAEDVSYILGNADVKALFVSSMEQYRRIASSLEAHPVLRRRVILFEDCKASETGPICFQDLLQEGGKLQEQDPELFESLYKGVPPEALATLIYTSGTTGRPKGVMLSHRNFIANYLGASERIYVDEKDVSLSFLPLSHVFERLAGYYFMAFRGACIAYAESMQTVPEDLALIQPTVAASVPRLYEKMHARILEKVNQAPAFKRGIFAWSLKKGRSYVRRKLSGEKVPLSLRFQYRVATRLVFRELKRKLGGRIRFFISGGAPLSKDLAEFFYTAGVLILEGYGLTETSPVIAVNSDKEFKFGTVGKPLPNAEVRIAEDGEILTQGPCVMSGYYKNSEASEEVLSGGWFHTGDIGEIDSDGFLKITDRKKDIIVTSGGKNISPQNIERKILTDPCFSQAVVVGDRRNYLVALIVPDRQAVTEQVKALGLEGLAWGELLRNPKICEYVESKLSVLMKDFPRYEQIKYFRLLENELTQENGELTPTLKVKRKVVMQKYERLIEDMYREGEQRRPFLSGKE